MTSQEALHNVNVGGKLRNRLHPIHYELLHLFVLNIVASYCIHFARCKSPMGLNILLCADRYQTNIDDILSGSSNYIVHSHYNRSIADVQLHASNFLSELVIIRDSRQSVFL